MPAALRPGAAVVAGAPTTDASRHAAGAGAAGRGGFCC